MFKPYRRVGLTEMEPWDHQAHGGGVEGLAEWGVNVSPEQEKAGSPKRGDMIARNAQNPKDKWLVSAEYFAANYEPETEAGDMRAMMKRQADWHRVVMEYLQRLEVKIGQLRLDIESLKDQPGLED